MKHSKVDKFIARYGIAIGMLSMSLLHILKNWIDIKDGVAVPILALICLFMIYSGFREGGSFRKDKNTGDMNLKQ